MTMLSTPKHPLKMASVIRAHAALFLLGLAALLSACGYDTSFRSAGGAGIGTVQPPTLTAISVAPADASIPLGLTQTYTAMGVYSDGTKSPLPTAVTWSSSNPQVAVISNAGLVATVSPGATTITATSGTISGATTLTVTAASLVSIGVTPAIPQIAAGTQQQFTATGIYTDNSTQNVSAAVTWASATPTVATISNTAGTQGLATGLIAGTSVISATLGGITGSTTLTVAGSTLVSITVTPANPSVAKGLQQQFTATGVYSNGVQQNLTAAVTWSSSATTATIGNVAGSQGLATAAAVGTATITATAAGGVAGSTTLTITPATLVSIAVTAPTVSIANGTNDQFTATGTYTDQTTQPLTNVVVWTSSAPAVATISIAPYNPGEAHGKAVGTTVITATSGTVVSPAVTLTVTPATLVSIALTPVNPTIVLGATQQFIATGTYTDGTTQVITNAVTYTSATPAVATISNAAGSKGLATAAAPGTTAITATAPGATPITSPIDTLTVKSAYAYATNIGSNNVSQYSIGLNGTLGPLITPANPAGAPPAMAGNSPFSIAVTPASTFAYVANYNRITGAPGTISQYSIGANGALTPLGVPSVAALSNPNSVTIDPSGSYVYVSNYNEPNVSEFDIGPGGALASPPGSGVGGAIFSTDAGPASIAITPANTFAYTANSTGNDVTQFAIGAGGALENINDSMMPVNVPAGNNPNYVIVDPTGRYVYVANYSSNNISEYSIGATGALTPLNPATVNTGTTPRFIAIDATGTYAYVADYGSNDVSQYTLVNGVLTPMNPQFVTTGANSSPNGVTIDQTGKFLYVADRGAAAISQFAINAMNGSLTPLPAPPANNTVAAGTGPTSIATSAP